MMLAVSVVFAGRDWLWMASALFGAGLLILAYGYWRAPAPGKTRWLGFLLKLLGMAALAACLVEPLLVGQRAKPGANHFVILADNSQGMQIRDRGSDRTRAEQLREWLGQPDAGWQAKLDEDFRVHRYVFDSRVQQSPDFSNLDFNGQATSLRSALATVRDRFSGEPLAGVVLLSDGNATDMEGDDPSLGTMAPVYPVVVGLDEPNRDLAIGQVTVAQSVFEDAPVTIQASVHATGFSRRPVKLTLTDLGGAPKRAESEWPESDVPGETSAPSPGQLVHEETRVAGSDDDEVGFRLQVRPSRPGITFYQLQVEPTVDADPDRETALESDGIALESESPSTELSGDRERDPEPVETINPSNRVEDVVSGPVPSAEATRVNNRQLIAVDRGSNIYRVLYVSGRPNWEFKFLSRALAEDLQIQLTALIRVARREPKFEFRSRTGESSNPLFRGFGRDEAESERYDQPVLIRLNTRTPDELRSGFPRTEEGLYAFHAIIFDDLEAEFFSRDQLVLLERFVSERGGGFFMLSGQESFREGGYDRTPVAKLLPVYLDRDSRGLSNDSWRLDLTREGWLQPWIRLRSTEGAEETRLRDMPAFKVLNLVGKVKPGAMVLAAVEDELGHSHPGLVAQRFGNGRVAALTIGDFWRWGLRDENKQRDLAKAWRQVIRWLVVDAPNRIEIRAEPLDAEGSGATRLTVRLRDRSFQPVDNANIQIRVQSVAANLGVGAGADAGAGAGAGSGAGSAAVDGSDSAAGEGPFRRPGVAPDLQFIAEPVLDEPGVYQAICPRLPVAGYVAEAIARDSSGIELGRAETGWTSDPAAREFASLKPNRALMETIARQSGGSVIPGGGLADWVKELPLVEAPVMEQWSRPLWQSPILFLFATACFLTEWWLRRRRGLA